jgi:cyanate permease
MIWRVFSVWIFHSLKKEAEAKKEEQRALSGLFDWFLAYTLPLYFTLQNAALFELWFSPLFSGSLSRHLNEQRPALTSFYDWHVKNYGVMASFKPFSR